MLFITYHTSGLLLFLEQYTVSQETKLLYVDITTDNNVVHEFSGNRSGFRIGSHR